MSTLVITLRKYLIPCTVLVLVVSAGSNAQWSSDPAVNTPISTVAGDQDSPRIASDSAGGAIIVWEDSRSGTYDIYAQRVDANGVVQWTSDGVAICTATNLQGSPAIVADGSGGAIMAWQDRRTGSYAIYAQRINASGVVQWTPNGVAITAAGGQLLPSLTTDGSGGAIITWNDNRIGAYAQRIDASGTVKWTADGVQVSSVDASTNKLPVIVNDGVGGAILAWQDSRSGTGYDIYAQRIDSTGAVRWGTNGVAISTATGEQGIPAIGSDGAGGAVITWQDYRSGTSYDSYAQRIDSTGAVQWTTDGVAVCTASNDQVFQSIVGDNPGGAVVVWRDNRSGGRLDIYAQRISSTGAVRWATNGIGVCTASGDKYAPAVIKDGSAGTIIAWDDLRSGAFGIYAQRYDSTGSAQWAVNGVRLCTDGTVPYMVSNGSGGAIVTWNSYAGNYNIKAQSISSNSVLPVEMVSFSVRAVKSSVEMSWTTSTEANNFGFEIERRPASSQVNVDIWNKVGFVAGSGTSSSPKEYSFTDNTVSSGRYAYRIKQIDKNGSFKYTQIAEVEVGTAPKQFSLVQNYPNPFNPSTTIDFSVPEDGHAVLKIVDLLGRDVATLFDGEAKSGYYQRVIFDATKMASGVYFSRLEFGGKQQLKKMLLMK